jgi:phosphoserine aminotransferase
MERVYNFSAGPTVLPMPVLEKAQKELVNYGGAGMSVMEMSHRSKAFIEIADNTKALLKEIMNIPDNYKVLFLQGGAWTQFGMVPLNLMTDKKRADFVDTGNWAAEALKEAGRFLTATVVASSKESNYDHIPALDPSKFDKDADYFHTTSNNTIYGTRFTDNWPDTGNVPLVCDMSSNILSEVYDVSKFGLIYAGAQKNMGPSGVTAVIIRDDLLARTPDHLPTMMKYTVHADKDSMHNTPPTYALYLAGLVYQWIKDLGGVPAMQKINEEKAKIIYDAIDESKLFKGTVNKKDRSLMNVTFVTENKDLDEKFAKEAEKKGMPNLKGPCITQCLRNPLRSW